jgi:betaine-aldehyde dehydrogenase
MATMTITDTLPTALQWIDGNWSDSPEHGDSVDPATGRVIGHYAQGTAEDARRAIGAADRAFRETV